MKSLLAAFEKLNSSANAKKYFSCLNSTVCRIEDSEGSSQPSVSYRCMASHIGMSRLISISPIVDKVTYLTAMSIGSECIDEFEIQAVTLERIATDGFYLVFTDKTHVLMVIFNLRAYG